MVMASSTSAAPQRTFVSGEAVEDPARRASRRKFDVHQALILAAARSIVIIDP
jgi:hypothetical protein